MKAFVITIMESENSVVSAQKCIDSCIQHGLEGVNFHKATTPENYILEHIIFPKVNFMNKWCRWDRAYAAFYSHYRLWHDCSISKEDYLILEHDARMIHLLPRELDFKGLLSLGAPSFGTWRTPRKGISKLTSKEYLPGAHAYLLKPEAAQELVEKAKNEAEPTDIFLNNKRFDFIEEFYPWPFKVEETFSTIQKVTGCKAKHQYKEGYKLI